MSLFEKRDLYQSGLIDKKQYIDEMHQLHFCLFEYADYIRDTDIASIEITAGQVLMTAKSTAVKIVCDRMNKRIAPIEILNFGSYEKTDAEIMIRLVEPGFSIFDIGANIGWYALSFARACDMLQVFAFEPIPETYSYLKKNIEINHADRVHPYNFGFSDQPGKVMFYFHPDSADNASAADLSGRDDVQYIECQVRTVDEFVAETGLRVDFIKCDVEGAELLVFKGAAETIKQYHPVIFAEMLRKWSAKFNYHPNEIIKFLSDLGYKCFTAKGKVLEEFFLMDERTLETNFFFLHTVKHASKISILAK
jgi:FkbM family methyltransferase